MLKATIDMTREPAVDIILSGALPEMLADLAVLTQSVLTKILTLPDCVEDKASLLTMSKYTLDYALREALKEAEAVQHEQE